LAYVDTLLSYGIPIVFGWVFAVQVGVPIPTVPLLLAVGALGALRKLSLGSALLAALGGSVVADLIWYGIGRRWGNRGLRVAVVGRAREMFLAHRLWALVLGKFFFEVNAAVAALAGSSGIRVSKFLVYDTASAALWAGVWIGVGYILQNSMNDGPAAATLGVSLIVEIAALLVVYGAVKCTRRRAPHPGDEHMSRRSSETCR
jgi:membrane protein DedA with SNARE-associated domain